MIWPTFRNIVNEMNDFFKWNCAYTFDFSFEFFSFQYVKLVEGYVLFTLKNTLFLNFVYQFYILYFYW